MPRIAVGHTALFLCLLLLVGQLEARPIWQQLSLHKVEPNGNLHEKTLLHGVFLPTNVRPVNYTIELAPYFNNFTYNGKVQATIEVVEATNVITLHSDKITILGVELVGYVSSSRSVEKIQNLTWNADVVLTRLSVSLPSGSTLAPGSVAELSIVFSSILNDDLAGFYRSSYVAPDGQTKWIAVTQFEATAARRAFPCWDEPALKAAFDVTLIVPAGLQGLANMPPINSTVLPDGSTRVTYGTTPRMSSYLVAFAVGEFECVTTTNRYGVQVSVYTVPGKKEQGEYALGVAAETIAYYSEFFGIQYPLPKSDLLAVPDFAAGAMENWGLITYRESQLLLDERNDPAVGKQNIAITVTHELAHQWFGNLVTMKWWSDLWLNEGFATFVSYIGTSHIHPDWEMWTQFVGDELALALSADSLETSHPVRVNITDPSEIDQVFDDLSYDKGGSLNRQVQAALGNSDFVKGLHAYLVAHEYSNTDTDDLWAALGEASGKPVKKFMDSYTLQSGYPLVTVTFLPNNSVELSQTRFLSKGVDVSGSNTTWWVPVRAKAGQTTDQGTTEVEFPEFFFSEAAAVVDIQVPEGWWLKLNVGQTAIYRVNYPESIWTLLTSAIKTPSPLSTADRLGLVMDVFALAKAGILRTSQALDVIWASKGETFYSVWSEITADLWEVNLVLAGGEDPLLQSSFKAAVRGLLRPVAAALGLEATPGESHLISMLRPLLLQQLVLFDDEETTAAVAQKFSNLTADPHSVDGNLAGVVMLAGVRSGGRQEYEAVQKLYNSSATALFKSRALIALAQVQTLDLLQEMFEYSYLSGDVRSQDILYVARGLKLNEVAWLPHWEYVKANWGAIYNKFRSSLTLTTRVISYPLDPFSSAIIADDAEAFFKEHPVPEASLGLAQTLENIRTRDSWRARDASDIEAWLSPSNPPAAEAHALA